MAVRRKAKPVAAAISKLADGQAALTLDLASLRAGFNRVAVELDKRPTRDEMQEGFAAVNGRLDRIITVLDTVVGKQRDNDQSHVVFGAMLGDHRRLLASHDERLTSLESRLPPRTP